LMLAASAAAPVDPTPAAAGAAYAVRSLPLPGANDDGIFMDYIAFDPHTGFVWAPAGNTGAVDVVDTATGKVTQIPGIPTTEAEGFAVDAARGRFYTNLEDKDRTLAIDLKSHQTVATWNPKCGEEGPHGLRIDEKGGLLFVACSARTEALDAGHDGAVLSSVDT